MDKDCFCRLTAKVKWRSRELPHQVVCFCRGIEGVFVQDREASRSLGRRRVQGREKSLWCGVIESGRDRASWMVSGRWLSLFGDGVVRQGKEGGKPQAPTVDSFRD